VLLVHIDGVLAGGLPSEDHDSSSWVSSRAGVNPPVDP